MNAHRWRPALLALLLPAGIPVLAAGDWPMLGGRPDRNMVATATGLPRDWAVAGSGGPARKVRWAAPLGDVTYGAPVVAAGRVLIGTNRAESSGAEKAGVLRCFSTEDGRLLWEAVHPKLADDAEDDSTIGLCSTPCVAGDEVFYVSNRGELVCRDVRDGREIWSLDFRARLGVEVNQASASSPLVVGELVFALTGNAAHPRTGKVRQPQAPSFVAVDRRTGRVVWQDASPGGRILTGQWGSPSHGVVDGVAQVLFPGGDGWLYAFSPADGRLLWKFNCKAHEKASPDGEPDTTFSLVAAPVITGHRVLVAVGEPEAGSGPGALRCIDARGRGDLTATGELWRLGGEDFNDSISTVAVHEGLVYAADAPGYIHCVDLETGRRLWVHDAKANIWGSPLVADGRLWVQTADGEVLQFALGRELRLLAKVPALPDAGHGTPVTAGGVLYLTGQRHLYAVGG